MVKDENTLFAFHLKSILDAYFLGKEWWKVFVEERGDKLLITATMLDEPEPLAASELRELVIWTFSETGRTAAILLPNPPDWMALLAHCMTGNLFGQGLTLAYPQGNAAAKEQHETTDH